MTDPPSLSAQIEAVRGAAEMRRGQYRSQAAAVLDAAAVTLQQHERLEAEIAEMEAGYQNAAELVLTYHGKNERLEAVVKAARQWRLSLEDDGWDEGAIMDLARPGIYALFSALAALDTVAPETPANTELAIAREDVAESSGGRR